MSHIAPAVAHQDAPTISVNFTDPAVNQDPYPVFDQLLEMGPVVHNLAGNEWLIPRYKEARAAFLDPARFDQDVDTFLRMFGGHNITTLGGPNHGELRKVFSHEFQHRTLERWDGMITEFVHGLVDPAVERIRDGEVVDLMGPVIHHIPSMVITGMLGLPQEFRENFMEWVEAMLGVFNAAIETDPERARELNARGVEARKVVSAYCGELLQTRRDEPGNIDLIRLLAENEDSLTFMNEDDLRSQVSQLVVAAQGNTANMMGHALVVLAKHPDQRRAIAADRSLIPQALEEIIRYQGSIMAALRVLRDGDYEIDGVTIPDGARVFILNGAANHDPRRWDEPNRFDIYREMKANLAFGFGMHNCIGINLARHEIRIFLERILDAIPEYELATDEIDYGRHFMARGPLAVPIAAG